MSDLADAIRGRLMWLRSFAKKEWDLGDYPLRYRDQGPNHPVDSRWCVQPVNWWGLTGLASTKSGALEELQKSFDAYRASGQTIPRPGAAVPMEFASCDRIDANRPIVRRLIAEILDYDPDSVFVSDESSLWDFTETDGIGDYQMKIREVFGTDVSHIEDGNIAALAEFLSGDGADQ